MPSPFPGMNPYLEQEYVWTEFHNKYLGLLQNALVPQVRPKYMVREDAMLFIHERSADQRRMTRLGDVSVHLSERGPGPWGSGTTTAAATSAVLLDAPVKATLPVAVEEVRHRQLYVRDRRTRQVVTVIEILSPTNKDAGPDRDSYLAKREQLLGGGVNLVEIDLLRGGPRMPIEDAPDTDYCVVVAEATSLPKAGVWPIGLRDPLPTIPIPLADGDPPARLDLQRPLHDVYDAAGYADFLYEVPPDPRLPKLDQAWADALIAAGRA